MYYSKNYWTHPEYKGVNTRWATPDGQRFEVQFHTPDSFHAKHHVTHLATAPAFSICETGKREGVGVAVAGPAGAGGYVLEAGGAQDADGVVAEGGEVSWRVAGADAG